jgi:hypothetical protein
LTPSILFILIGGIYFPVYSWIQGIIFFVARLFFTAYVSLKGAAHPVRIAGALLGDISLLTGFILSVISALKFACWI